MKLCINGQNRDYQEPLSVQQLLQELDLSPQRVIVELNQEILLAANHSATKLQDGDSLELIQFVGGG